MWFYKKEKVEGSLSFKTNKILLAIGIILAIICFSIVLFYATQTDQVPHKGITMLITGLIGGLIVGLIMGEKGAVDAIS